MKILLYIILLLLGLFTNAQEIIGSWKVKDIIHYDNLVVNDSMVTSFKTATFIFKKDSSILLKSKTLTFGFEALEIAVNSSVWKIDSITNWIVIGYNKKGMLPKNADYITKLKNASGLIIKLETTENKKYFTINDGYLKVEVVKTSQEI